MPDRLSVPRLSMAGVSQVSRASLGLFEVSRGCSCMPRQGADNVDKGNKMCITSRKYRLMG